MQKTPALDVTCITFNTREENCGKIIIISTASNKIIVDDYQLFVVS